MVVAHNTYKRRDLLKFLKKGEHIMVTEKQKKIESTLTFDPGYLMLGMYVLGVTVLVLSAWFGGNAGALEHEQNRGVVVASGQERHDAGRQDIFSASEYGSLPALVVDSDVSSVTTL
jgi:hypothetical protein